MLNYLLSLLAAFFSGTLIGYWGGLKYAKASSAHRNDAIRLSLATSLTLTYLTAVLCREFGLTNVDPPWLLGGMVGVVVAYTFPKGFFKISRDGMEVGGSGTDAAKESGSASVPSP